jgi:ABC-type dipeptide/oligopeptide/nickel transport system ATPase component
VPSLVGKFTGCRFADRCDHVTDACRNNDIELRAESGKTQCYRCIIDAKKMAKVA